MAVSTEPALTVLAWGNESRGDDAIGAILARRISDLGHPAIELIEDHQLNIEHLMDFRDSAPVLFVDASVAIDSDYFLEKLHPQMDDSMSTHSISPTALLALFEQTLKRPAPDAYLLHVRGRVFELGETVSPDTRASVESAWQFLTGILARPVRQWHKALEAASGDLVS